METLNYEESLEWSVFSAALTSYKYGSFVESELIIHDDKKELERLSNQISDKLLIEKYDNVELDYLQKFKNHKKFNLQLCPFESYKEILSSYAKNEKIDIDYSNVLIFKVDKTDLESTSNKQYDELKAKHGIIKGMHGSSVTSFYSILQNGLMNKEKFDLPALFGSGVYFSTKLDVALQFSRSFTFSYGLFKDRSLQIVALCEIINDPNVVKSELNGGNQKIPPEYILVKDDSIIRVTHLMVKLSCSVTELKKIQQNYIHSASSSQQNVPRQRNLFSRLFQRLLIKIRQNALFTLLFIYALILIYVRALSNKSFLSWNWESDGDFED